MKTAKVRVTLFLAAAALAPGPGTDLGAQRVKTVFSQYRPQVDPAVERALAYLAAAQLSHDDFPGRYGRSTGVVALVGMAFLSKGYLPGDAPYGRTVDRCIDYVLRHRKADGMLDAGDAGHGPMYAHNIATLFLSEVSGMVDDDRRQARLEEALAGALKVILEAQAVPKSPHHQGGWRYQPNSADSDLSCSGWALMALRSARLNGAPVPDGAIRSAVDYVLRHHDEEAGRFGYQNTSQHSNTLTGCGLLCLELTGFHGTPSTFRAGDYILDTRTSITRSRHEFYANYYNAQGTFQLGGKYWARYAAWMYPNYLASQQADGSWHQQHSAPYSTAMMVLAFTVPYRQLPIYQRDETVGDGG